MYKVGDIVRVDPNLEECWDDSGVDYGMLSYRGCEVKIVDKYKSRNESFMVYKIDIDEGYYYWNDWMFVPYIDLLKDFLSKLHNEK